MLRILHILLAAFIATNFASSAAALHPFDVRRSNAGTRGRSNAINSSSSRRRRTLRAKNDNADSRIAAEQILKRREQEESTVAPGSVSDVPSTAPSEAGSFTSTTTTTTVGTSAINTVGGADEIDNNVTMTGSTMAEEVPGGNDDNDNDGIAAANDTTSFVGTKAPSLSPPVNSNWESSSNVTTTTAATATSSSSNALGEGDPNVSTPNPSPTSSSGSSTYSPSNIGTGGAGEEGEGTEELGEPLIRDGSNVPTPSMGDANSNSENSWNNDDFENNNDDYYDQQASFVPTPSNMYYVNENDDFYAAEESVWEDAYTPPPTMVYIPPPSDKDPLIEDAAEESGGVVEGGDGGNESSNMNAEGDGNNNNNNGDENVLYHGLGGKVGTYMDGVESPSDMEQDKNVQIVTGTLLSVFIVALLVTAHLVMHHPDGLCAGCCRLALGLIGCAGRTLCLPCRAVCCPSEQSRSRRSHAPMRTPFPTDLELS
jgi:hypothetical protein